MGKKKNKYPSEKSDEAQTPVTPSVQPQQQSTPIAQQEQKKKQKQPSSDTQSTSQATVASTSQGQQGKAQWKEKGDKKPKIKTEGQFKQPWEQNQPTSQKQQSQSAPQRSANQQNVQRQQPTGGQNVPAVQSAWGSQEQQQRGATQRPQQQQQQQQQQQGRRPQQSSSRASISSQGSTASLPLDMTKLSLTAYNPKIPIETSPDGSVYEGKRGKKCKVEVNYGTISLNEKFFPKTAFHYHLSFDPTASKKMHPIALKAFMTNNFGSYLYGTDDRSNLYTAKKLEINGTQIETYTKEAVAVVGDRSRTFKITLKYATEVDLGVLYDYRNPQNEKLDKPSTAVQVLDIILKSAFSGVLEQNKAVRAGRQVFFIPPKRMPLSDGMELWYGLFQSAILGRSKIYLNADVLHKAFPSAMNVLDYLASISRDGRVPQRLGDRDREYYQLKDFLSMLSVQYRTNDREAWKSYGVNGLARGARDEFFEQDGRKMSVDEYYRNVKRMPLRFPDLPCLWVGSRQKRIVLPMEFCFIPPGQANNKKCGNKIVAELIKYSATSTPERKEKILNLLRQIDYANNKTISGFGIRVDPQFQNIDARVIDPPQLQYKNDKIVTPAKGVWQEGTYLKTDSKEINWAIVNCDDRTGTMALENLKKMIVSEGRKQNLFLRDLKSKDYINLGRSRNLKLDLEDIFDQCKKSGCELVIVIVIEQFDCYARVKQAAELKVGLLTQCIKSRTVSRMNPMTVKNILLKLNSKLNGTNHTIKESSYNDFNDFNKKSGVMFIGADVTHPGPEARDIPSVVGVASSYDDVGFRYCCAWRLQDPKKEMIVDLEEIVTSHMQFYKKKNNMLPGKIMYYRDGVSDGQFRQILDIEMSAIRGAMKKVFGPDENKHAKVTFIVVQKRHHTRFFPIEQAFTDGKFKNIVPGTVVDKDILHPFQYQFFMASHAAIQGVTKPTKYCILINESKIQPDILQAITYDLCHLFTRCNRAVSYPAPCYYSHLMAARGKNYIIGERLNMRNLQNEYKNREIRPDFFNNTPMFFV